MATLIDKTLEELNHRDHDLVVLGIYIYMYTHTYIYMYAHTEKDRLRDRE